MLLATCACKQTTMIDVGTAFQQLYAGLTAERAECDYQRCRSWPRNYQPWLSPVKPHQHNAARWTVTPLRFHTFYASNVQLGICISESNDLLQSWSAVCNWCQHLWVSNLELPDLNLCLVKRQFKSWKKHIQLSDIKSFKLHHPTQFVTHRRYLQNLSLNFQYGGNLYLKSKFLWKIQSTEGFTIFFDSGCIKLTFALYSILKLSDWSPRIQNEVPNMRVSVWGVHLEFSSQEMDQASISKASRQLDIIQELSTLLNTGLSRRELSILTALIENGCNPEVSTFFHSPIHLLKNSWVHEPHASVLGMPVLPFTDAQACMAKQFHIFASGTHVVHNKLFSAHTFIDIHVLRWDFSCPAWFFWAWCLT